MRRACLVLAFSAMVLAPASSAEAHGVQTAYVEIVEAAPGHATVHLRVAATNAHITLETSGGCSLEPAGDSPSPFDTAWLLACPGSIAGHAMAVRGLGLSVDDAVVWMSFVDGTTASRVVSAREPRFELRSAASGWSVATQYTRLGVVHILTGYDHLVFLVLLVLLLRRPRSVIIAETAFTLSHSLAFSVTALGWLHVSAAAAESCIALSLVLLAADVNLRETPPSAWRGAGMAFVFGLVHGLGFAGGLRDIGLPERSVPQALVSFGVGVEAGQVAFLSVVLGALFLARRVRFLPKVELATVYAAGIMSALWLFQRVAVCVRPIT